MKVGKWIMTALSVVVIVGICCIIVASAVLGWRAGRTMKSGQSHTKSAYTEQTAEISEVFTSVDIEAAKDMEVRLVSSGDDICRVVYYNSDDVVHSVYVEDETLRISCSDDRAFGSDLGFGDDPVITVELPKRNYKTIRLVSDSGSLQSNASVECGDFLVEQNKGEVDLANIDCTNAEVVTKSGDVSMATVSAEYVLLNGSSADFSVMNVDGQDMRFDVGSGMLEGYNIHAGKRGVFETDKGDIIMQLLSGASLTFETGKGDVELSLAEDMRIQASSVSGSVELPEEPADGNGLCLVTTESGDVSVTYVQR